MRVLISLALLSVAFANPAVEPVELPEAPMPAVEWMDIQMIQMPDIKPLMIPKELSEKLNAFGELIDDPVETVDTVRVVDNAPIETVEILSPVKVVDIAPPMDAVKVVDIAPSMDAEIAVDAVRVVEFAENLGAPINVDAVKVVDNLEVLPTEYIIPEAYRRSEQNPVFMAHPDRFYNDPYLRAL